MKIFIPSFNDPNPYLDEFIVHSSHSFVLDHYTRFSEDFDIVNIHWPEAIFNWKVPSRVELNRLIKEIKRWKQFSKIVYTRHDEKPHFGTNVYYDELFDLIIKNADAVMHLGSYSKNQYELKFPKKEHFIVPHPLYRNSFKSIDKFEARKRLGIKSDALAIIAPGRIRNKREKELVLKAFKKLKEKNKVLLSNYMLEDDFFIEFPGRVKLKEYFDFNAFVKKLKNEKYSEPKYLFNYEFSSEEKLSLMMSAADVVFLPRIKNLNSGNLWLALTYKKIVTGPGIGNIKEYLEQFGMPFFDPENDNSVDAALKNAVELFKNSNFKVEDKFDQSYEPVFVANLIDKHFENLMK